VLHNGTIAERGTHEQLLAEKGRYATMWEKHCRAERAMRDAQIATANANKLLAQANISGGGHVTGQADDPSDGYTSMASSTILQTGLNSPREEHGGSSVGSDDGTQTTSVAGSYAGSHRDDASMHAGFAFDDQSQLVPAEGQLDSNGSGTSDSSFNH